MTIPTDIPQTPPVGRYVLDASNSTVTFVTKHMFGLGKVRGRFAVTAGQVVVAERADDSSAEAEISASSFSTRNPMRDIQVRSPLFLNARRHPAMAFHIDGAQYREGSWTGTGSLTVKGASAPVEFTVTNIERKGDSVVFTALGKVDRYAHGITMMRGMAARYLTFEVTAHANKA